MQTGADNFIRNTKAAEKPVHFSPTAKNGIRVTHNASVKTVKVAKTTLGKINDVSDIRAGIWLTLTGPICRCGEGVQYDG
jgi:spartin